MKPRLSLQIARFSLISLSLCVPALTQDALQTLEPLTVLGNREQLFKEVGSAAYLDEEEIRRSNSTNVNAVLAKVPGLYVREEDGSGNFVNLSIRGADGTRSEKVTVMEDGILASPAPYAGPAAYYTPHIARMSGLEVLKGSSQVRFGPQTTGGVVNYLSTPIPEKETYYGKLTYGSHNTFFGHGYNGNTRPGTRTSRDGKIDSFLIFNLGAYYQVNDQIRVLAGVQNLFDDRSISSRVPEGPRANAPRSLYVGCEATF